MYYVLYPVQGPINEKKAGLLRASLLDHFIKE